MSRAVCDISSEKNGGTWGYTFQRVDTKCWASESENKRMQKRTKDAFCYPKLLDGLLNQISIFLPRFEHQV
jgi:hypothetical protein